MSDKIYLIAFWNTFHVIATWPAHTHMRDIGKDILDNFNKLFPSAYEEFIDIYDTDVDDDASFNFLNRRIVPTSNVTAEQSFEQVIEYYRNNINEFLDLFKHPIDPDTDVNKNVNNGNNNDIYDDNEDSDDENYMSLDSYHILTPDTVVNQMIQLLKGNRGYHVVAWNDENVTEFS